MVVASSGISALLLPGGRTYHSRFQIPINPLENATCDIKHGTQLAELISLTSLIIWDEAPMDHRYAFEAVDRSLKDILSINDLSLTNAPFGGKTILLGGDFRQILPVVPKGKRQDIVLGSINRSHLWDNCQVFLLTKNMRVNEDLTTTASRNKILEFKKWVLDIGDGTVPAIAKDGEIKETWIKIPDEFLIEPEKDPIEKIVTSSYPLFEEMQGNTEYLKERAILTPKNETVNEINQYMLQFVPGEKNHYLNSDSI